MGKLLLLLSCLALLFLGFGTILEPNNPIFWLASSSRFYQDLRVGMGVILLLQFITKPPRHIVFRVLAGGLAILVGVWTVKQTYFFHMPLLDTCAFLSASVAMLVAALERRTKLLPTPSHYHM